MRKIFREVIPGLYRIVYLVAFKLVLDVVPLHPKLADWLNHAVYVFGVYVVLWLVRRLAMLGIEWSAVRAQASATLQQGFLPLMRNVVTLFIFFSGAIMVLKHFNYDVMSLITALGVGSLAVGLAAKDTLSNMISGFTLIIDRNLHPGDRISLAGATGEVEEIGLRSTRIRTGNGSMLIVPNAELVNTRILNLSQPTRAVAGSVSVRVSAKVPFEQVRKLCLEVVGGLERAKRGSVHLASLADGHQLVNVGFWVDDLDQEGAAVSELNEKLQARFAREGIPLLGAAGV
jgi:small-conductance mechanosensitive channel